MNNFTILSFVTLLILLISKVAISNDYMSTELKKAIDLECKQSLKDNLFNTKAECENSLIESLNKIGIVSVTRINDEEIQNDIEGICVFAKKRGALEYNKCVHKEVYAYLGIEIIEMPLVVNKPVAEEKQIEISQNIEEKKIETNQENKKQENEDISEEEIYINEEEIEIVSNDIDSEKIITKVDPERPITERVEIEFPENLLKTISEKAIPSTYYVLNWIENPNKKEKRKYIVSGLGSAVAIRKDMLATACHVVTNYIFNEEGKITGEEFSLINVMHVNSNPKNPDSWFRGLKLVGKDFKTDRCILQHDDLNAIPASMRDYKDLTEYEKIYAVGNPGGYYGKVAEGKITRLYDFPPPRTYLRSWSEEEIPIIETDAPIDKGNSGGGLFDVSGNLIGICSMCEILGGAKECWDSDGNSILNPTNVYEQCDLRCNKTQPQNWFIPISRFEELLDD